MLSELKKYTQEELCDLAEICGIHAGDGYLRNGGGRWELDLSGHYEEKEYYDLHVIPLFNRFFGLNIMGRFFPHRRTYGFVIRDRNVIQFMHKIGFPYGSKTYTVDVPDFIKSNKTLAARFLRGYFDTDGCITFCKKYGTASIFKRTRETYPRILFTTVSLALGGSLSKLLVKSGFKFYSGIHPPKRTNFKRTYDIHINGVNGLNLWLDSFGTCSSVKKSRILVWKKFGFCPPNTNLEQRHKLLKGELHPDDYYKGA